MNMEVDPSDTLVRFTDTAPGATKFCHSRNISTSILLSKTDSARSRLYLPTVGTETVSILIRLVDGASQIVPTDVMREVDCVSVILCDFQWVRASLNQFK